jgi:uncharacterized membrane protein
MSRKRFSELDAEYRPELVPESELGESALWPAAAILSAAALYVTLPSKFIVGKQANVIGDIRWVVAGLTLVLLAALLLALPRGPIERIMDIEAMRLRVGRRILVLTITALLSAANAASIYVLVHVLVNGGQVVAAPLLRAAVHLWCVNVLMFALWYWQLDGGGPAKRLTVPIRERDFYFPQQGDPAQFAGTWRPTFLDYFYVSYTNSAAFSPTDAMPLSRWAKMLMLVQSAISLTLGLMVVARAVNILR